MIPASDLSCARTAETFRSAATLALPVHRHPYIWGIALTEMLRQFIQLPEQTLWVLIDQLADDFLCLADLSLARRSNNVVVIGKRGVPFKARNKGLFCDALLAETRIDLCGRRTSSFSTTKNLSSLKNNIFCLQQRPFEQRV